MKNKQHFRTREILLGTYRKKSNDKTSDFITFSDNAQMLASEKYNFPVSHENYQLCIIFKT